MYQPTLNSIYISMNVKIAPILRRNLNTYKIMITENFPFVTSWGQNRPIHASLFFSLLWWINPVQFRILSIHDVLIYELKCTIKTPTSVELLIFSSNSQNDADLAAPNVKRFTCIISRSGVTIGFQLIYWKDRLRRGRKMTPRFSFFCVVADA